MTRDELNDKAREAGITDPESYPNMEELEAAIRAQSETGDEGGAAQPAGVGNDTIPHTDKDAPRTTRSDATDLGVPMRPLADGEQPRQGPEDALDPNARGDYSGRIAAGPSVAMEPVPASERAPEEVTGTVAVNEGQDERDVTVREPTPNVRPREVAPGR